MVANDHRAIRPPLALIAGPTASGKSDLAVRLALELKAAGRPAVIINADSAQVYADLAVLSARPTPEEMQGIPHLLFGDWDGASTCSAGDWAVAAKECVAAAHHAGQVPILVGGTGLYMRTLLDGIAPVPPIDAATRTAVRALSTAEAYAALQTEDPERAGVLNPNDSSRIARALEVIRATGKPLHAWQQELEGGIREIVQLAPAILLPDRQWLYARCDLRFERMLQRGAVQEVETLLKRNLSTELPVMRAIGVPEITAYLRGEDSLEAVQTRGAQATRNYAKRQYTWFRNQPPADWPRLINDNYQVDACFEILFQ